MICTYGSVGMYIRDRGFWGRSWRSWRCSGLHVDRPFMSGCRQEVNGLDRVVGIRKEDSGGYHWSMSVACRASGCCIDISKPSTA